MYNGDCYGNGGGGNCDDNGGCNGDYGGDDDRCGSDGGGCDDGDDDGGDGGGDDDGCGGDGGEYVLVVKYFFMFRSVFIADTGKEVFVWIGKHASEGESKNGLAYAHVSCS